MNIDTQGRVMRGGRPVALLMQYATEQDKALLCNADRLLAAAVALSAGSDMYGPNQHLIWSKHKEELDAAIAACAGQPPVLIKEGEL